MFSFFLLHNAVVGEYTAAVCGSKTPVVLTIAVVVCTGDCCPEDAGTGQYNTASIKYPVSLITIFQTLCTCSAGVRTGVGSNRNCLINSRAVIKKYLG